MQIIAVQRDQNRRVTGAIAALSRAEIEAITGINTDGYNQQFYDNMKVKVCEPWHHNKSIESKAKEFVKLPRQLRTLADMLEMTVPAIETVIAKPDEEDHPQE